MANSSNQRIFLNATDKLGELINAKANELFVALNSFDTNSLGVADAYNDYFIHHHLGKRLFFSIQNSAHILYESIQRCNKPVNEIKAIDYGAGLGTLFMLGGMLGCKQFDYNDHLPDWKPTAAAICKVAGINITNFVLGDINAVTYFAMANNFRYDIVVSRNVIEHIYSLPEFYSVLYKHNPNAVIYSTTTANFHNPAMRLYHIYIHKKVEKKYYRQQRIEEIKKIQPLIPIDQLTKLTQLTRGKGKQDFIDAVKNFTNGDTIKTDATLRSNTCDCIIGVWSEHLLNKREYATIITDAGFKMEFTAGYWDTHYAFAAINVLAKIFNSIILMLGKKNGCLLSPFVNVVACN